MCLTIPKKIITLSADRATVIDANGNQQEVIIATIKKPQINDWVLVNANIAISKISATEAKKINNIYKDQNAM